MSNSYTVQELASDKTLWETYVDPDNNAPFDSMTQQEREDMIREIWPNTQQRKGKIMPRIYVVSLSDYNAGILHGIWIDVDGKDAEEIKEEIQEMLAESRNQPAEEYAIFDYEDFSVINIHEYESIDTIAALAEAIEDHGEAFALVYADYGDIDSAITAVKDRYCGEYDSMEEYAEELYNDCYEIPEFLQNYIDYEAIARDLSFEMSVYESESGTVHIFYG